MNATDTLLAVFSRAPVPGAVKRRLIPALGAEGAAALQARMTRHIVAEARASELGPVQLWCSPDCGHPLFCELAGVPGVELCAQPAGDLGERMRVAFELGLARAARVVLVGSDCPGLTASAIAAAAARLEEHEAVIGIAADGGYVLLGLSRPAPSLFGEMPWGTSEVLAETRRRIAVLGWRWAETGPFYDIDRPEDLAGLPAGWSSAAVLGRRALSR